MGNIQVDTLEPVQAHKLAVEQQHTGVVELRMALQFVVVAELQLESVG